VAVVEFNDQSDLRRLLALEVRSRPRVSAGTGRAIINGAGPVRIETVTDHRFEDSCRLIAGLEPRYVNRTLVRADRQSPRSVGEERQDPDGLAAERRPQIIGIENPCVGASYPGSGELRIAGARNVGDGGVCTLLSAMGGRNERAERGTGKHDVARLVADQQCAGNARGPR